jgi:hypothetical protein
MFQLLPQPQHIRIGHGVFSPPPNIHVASLPPEADVAARLALFSLMTELRTASRRPVYPLVEGHAADVRLALRRSAQNESYTMVVHPKHIEITGEGKPGLFYGIQTLRQLVQQFGAEIPCCVIHDAPSFPHRAFYLDISRGRVPRLETLRQFADLLAYLKINQLQLYVEHVFAFSFDPDISAGCDMLTPFEVEALAEYCRLRHIQLVPSLACFGHMGRILSLPQYRGLAEVPWPAQTWETSRWIERLRGATINPRHSESKKLLRRMLNDFLPHFSSTFFNMCGDETYDLGQGVNAAWVRRHGIGALYATHVRFLRKLAAKHGKRLMLWGDMLLKHPDAIRALPKDCIVLDWGYEPDMDFPKVRAFLEAGLEAYVCPSTRGYRVVFNDVEKARANIAGYAREAVRAGACGIMTTDWGDMGHFNLPAASLHGLALGAAMSWNPRADFGKDFDRTFSLQLFGDARGAAAAAFRQAGSCGTTQWPLMLTGAPPEFNTKATMALAERARSMASRCAAIFETLSSDAARILPSSACAELRLACRAVELTARGMLLSRGKDGQRAQNRNAFADALWEYFHEYASVWKPHYKPLGLQDLERAFRRVIFRLRRGARLPTRSDLP